MIPTEILNLGAVSILFFLFLEKFFSYLKIKKDRNGNNKTTIDYEQDLNNINVQLSNHMNDMGKDIAGIQTDVKIMRNDINDIKIALKK